MRYDYGKNIKLTKIPLEWDKNSGRETLQYALGGLLYMPSTNKRIVSDLVENRFDSVKSLVLCLEDAIGDKIVDFAEECVAEIIEGIYEELNKNTISIRRLPLIFIRVREPEQIKRVYKKCGEKLFEVITGFNMPKFDDTNCDDYINAFTNVVKNGNTYMMPIFENERIMDKHNRIENLMVVKDKLSCVKDNVLNIRVGATDYQNIFAIRRGEKHTVYDIKVIADCLADIINIFSRDYVCSAPVWEYFGNTDGAWLDGLKRELEMDKLNGFIGKTCIHPSQLRYVQENQIVEYRDYMDALSIIGNTEELVGVTKGVCGERMNEVKVHINWARKIMKLAQIYGVKSKG